MKKTLAFLALSALMMTGAQAHADVVMTPTQLSQTSQATLDALSVMPCYDSNGIPEADSTNTYYNTEIQALLSAPASGSMSTSSQPVLTFYGASNNGLTADSERAALKITSSSDQKSIASIEYDVQEYTQVNAGTLVNPIALHAMGNDGYRNLSQLKVVIVA